MSFQLPISLVHWNWCKDSKRFQIIRYEVRRNSNYRVIKPKSVIRLRFLLVLVWSRLQWLRWRYICQPQKYNKSTGGQEPINPVKKESFIRGNWVTTPFERSSYSVPTECLPNFKKVPTLFWKSLYPFSKNSIGYWKIGYNPFFQGV